MRKILTFVGAAIVLGLAAYGAVRLLSDSLTSTHGRKAVEVSGPFAEGVASAAKERVKESLTNTPDQALEENAEFWTRKLYPITKGILKGQTRAIQEDPNRDEVPRLMYERGKDLAENVAKPFVRGLAEGSSGIVKDVARSLKGVREFRDENRDLLEGIARELGNLSRGIREKLPPPSPLPGPPHRPFMPPSGPGTSP